MSKQYTQDTEGIWSFLTETRMDRKTFIDIYINNEEERKYILTDGMENLVTNKMRFVSKTQIRTLYEEVQRADPNNLAKLQVKLIYIAGKLEKKDIKDFIVLLIDVLKKNFDLGKDFIESTLAYHKFHAKN